MINDLTAQGMAIILYHLNFLNWMGMSDRVPVMYEGHGNREFSRDELSEEAAIMRCGTEVGNDMKNQLNKMHPKAF